MLVGCRLMNTCFTLCAHAPASGIGTGLCLPSCNFCCLSLSRHFCGLCLWVQGLGPTNVFCQCAQVGRQADTGRLGRSKIPPTAVFQRAWLTREVFVNLHRGLCVVQWTHGSMSAHQRSSTGFFLCSPSHLRPVPCTTTDWSEHRLIVFLTTMGVVKNERWHGCDSTGKEGWVLPVRVAFAHQSVPWRATLFLHNSNQFTLSWEPLARHLLTACSHSLGLVEDPHLIMIRDLGHACARGKWGEGGLPTCALCLSVGRRHAVAHGARSASMGLVGAVYPKE